MSLSTLPPEMQFLTGTFHVVAAVIVAGGVAKALDPDPFASLLRSLRLPHGRLWARGAAVTEIAVGVWAIVAGGRLAALVVGSLYLLFAAVVVLARRAGAASCGCFGAAAAPPSVVHVVVNLASGSLALLATLGELPGLGTVLAGQPVGGMLYVFLVALGAWLLVTLDTVGSVVVDHIGLVASMRPTFRENARDSHDHRHSTRTGGARA